MLFDERAHNFFLVFRSAFEKSKSDRIRKLFRTLTLGPTTTSATTIAFESEFPSEVLCPYVVSNMIGENYASDCKSSSRCSSKFIGPCGYALLIKLRAQLCKPHNAEMVILAIGQELGKLGREYENETGDKCNENIKIKALVNRKSGKVDVPLC